MSIGRDGTPRVGFIGLGIMGRPMATNVLRAGFPLVVCSRQRGPVDALVALGAEAASTPQAVAAGSDIIVVMVATLRDLEEVMIGVSGLVDGLRPGAVVVAMGTHEPEGVVACAAYARKRRASLIDAPVSGGEVGAQEGSLSIMVGGTRRAVTKAMPVLGAMGSSIVHVGEVGAGQIAKACNQLVVASTIEAVAEALALAAAAGVDPRRVREAMRGGFAASRVLELHGQRMLDGNFVPGGRVELHAKDARIIRKTARNLGVALPGFEPVAEQLDELIRRGDGRLDHSALVTLVDEGSRSGLRARIRRESPQ